MKKRIKKMQTFDYINYAFLIIFSFICLYPMWYVLIGSFNEGLDYVKGGVWFLPRVPTYANYVIIFNDSRLWVGFFITITRTIVGTLSAVLFTAAVGSGMSRANLPFRKLIYNFNLFTMFFGGGLVPYFLVINAIGLYDSFWVYIIPGIYSVYNMIIMQNFFKGIPEEMHESCVLDGANEYTIFFKFYLPLSKPVIATVSLWVAVGHWNSFFDTMMYTSSEELQSLQYYLLQVIKEASFVATGAPLPPEALERISVETVTFAAIIVSSLPIVVFYPFLMKYFEKGILLGSLKG